MLLGGHRRGFSWLVALLLVAAVLSCKVQAYRWIAPHLAVRTLFDCLQVDLSGYSACATHFPLCLPLGCLLLIKVGRSKSVEVQRTWEVL